MKNGSNVIIYRYTKLNYNILDLRKIHNEKFNYIKFWCDLDIIIRIECILLKFHWGMKALIELHFQHEVALH
jgi:hypothetical protein